MKNNHVNITIYGNVHGVFFRAGALEQAQALQITGFACNKQDGTVCIEAEGNREALDQFIEWCRIGPPNAKVTKINVAEGTVSGFKTFTIKRDGLTCS